MRRRARINHHTRWPLYITMSQLKNKHAGDSRKSASRVTALFVTSDIYLEERERLGFMNMDE